MALLWERLALLPPTAETAVTLQGLAVRVDHLLGAVVAAALLPMEPVQGPVERVVKGCVESTLGKGIT
jgi:hypothetical protein